MFKLGQHCPAVPTLLLLDSFAPTELAQMPAQALNHCGMVWVLHQDQQSVTTASDLIFLHCFQSILVALLQVLPAKSMVLHPVACYQESRWDSSSSGMLPGVSLGLCRCPLRFSTVANELTRSLSCSSTAAISCTFQFRLLATATI